MNTVEAVKTDAEIKTIARILGKRHGKLYADIWMVGINLALRISDLLSLTFEQTDFDKRVVNDVVESKTGKGRPLDLNKVAFEIVSRRRQEHPDHVFVFQPPHSNRSKGKAVSRQAVSAAFKEVGRSLGLKLGTHSMRKTRGWWMLEHGATLAFVAKTLNHSGEAETMRYIGIEERDIRSGYHQFVIG